MEMFQQFEIAWILWIQNLGAWLETPLKAATMLGKEEFFIIAMPALFWCIDSVLGFRVGIMLLLTNGVNAMFKLAFHSPRPYWFDPNIRALDSETSFGAPSGHAQHALSIWGLLAASTRSTTARVLLGVLIFVIGFSRIYLGMHFISDVLIGWAIGALLLWGYLKVEHRVRDWLLGLSLREMIQAGVITSILLGGSVVLTRFALGSWAVPEAWNATAAITLPDGEVAPLDLSGAFTIAGTWLGMMLGAAWYYHRTGRLFNAAGTPVQRLLRYAVGLVGIFILWFGLGQIFPREADILSYALRYLRYTLVGLWVSAGAPLIFAKIGLANAARESITSLFAE